MAATPSSDIPAPSSAARIPSGDLDVGQLGQPEPRAERPGGRPHADVLGAEQQPDRVPRGVASQQPLGGLARDVRGRDHRDRAGRPRSRSR